MNPHLFLFSPGRWIGSGKITFNGSPSLIRFYTSWQIVKDSESCTSCLQHVEMQGVDEKVINHFVVEAISERKFRINLQSESIGNADGTGIIESGLIAWEFHGGAGVEGFEVTSYKRMEIICCMQSTFHPINLELLSMLGSGKKSKRIKSFVIYKNLYKKGGIQ